MDIPENEHKKLIILSFKGREILEVAIRFAPLVISILPKKSEYKEFFGSFIKDSILLKMMLILALFFIIPIRTEKIIMKPPTCMVVLRAFSIATLKFCPKFLVFFMEALINLLFAVDVFFVSSPIIIKEK